MLLHCLGLADRRDRAPSAPTVPAMARGIGARTTTTPLYRAQADDTIPTPSARCIGDSLRHAHARRDRRPAFSAPARRTPVRARNAGLVQPNIDHPRTAARAACGSGRRTRRVPAVSPGARPANGPRRCMRPSTSTSGTSVGRCDSAARMAPRALAIGDFSALFGVHFSHLATAGSAFCTGTHQWDHDAR